MTLRRAAIVIAAIGSLVGAVPVTAQQRFPRFSAPLVDAADVVPDDVERQVNASLHDYQRRSGNQIAVAVVRTLGRSSLEDYAEDLFDEWEVGEKDKDNGVLLVVAMRERDLRIEVGYGLEGELTDLESGRIIRNVITPRMREGDVGGALQAGTTAIRGALGDRGAAPPPEDQPSDERGGSSSQLFLALIPLLFLFAAFRGRSRRRRRRWDVWPIFWGGGLGGSGGSGGFGGGFGGGGFGGGGGGGSGGGGASGGW